jgi:hypothetical protein
LLYHFSHIDHLRSIATDGLLADNEITGSDRLRVEVGQPSIKQQRRRRALPGAAGGVVADYVPFYYASRSPMLYAIHKGRVAEYDGGQDALAYLVTTVERVVALGLRPLYSDRNAVLTLTRFTADVDALDALVDWDLMADRYWHNTPDEPDRRERRMAECLVHRCVPWEAFVEVGVRSPGRCAEVERLLDGVAGSPPVRSHPDWYF